MADGSRRRFGNRSAWAPLGIVFVLALAAVLSIRRARGRRPPASEPPTPSAATHPWSRRDTALLVLLLVCVPAFAGIGRLPSGCRDLHGRVSLAGDASVANQALAACAGTSVGDIRGVLVIDTVFAVFYGVVLTAALLRWWERGWRARPLSPLLPAVRWLPAAAATFDVAENVVLMSTIGGGGREALTIGEGWAELVSVLSWWKLGTAALAVLAVVLSMLGAIGYRDLPATASGPTGDGRGSGDVDGEGISLSGGGIRAASFALGALQGLDEAGRFRSAKYLSAVSGGAYTGAAWYIARDTPEDAPDVRPEPTATQDLLLGAEQPRGVPNRFKYIRANRRYLATGRGGLPLSVIAVVLALAFHLLLLATAVYLVAWPAGRFVSSSVVVDGLITCTHAEPCDALPERRLAWPAVVPAAVALLAFLVSLGLTGTGYVRARRVVLGAAGAAAAAALALLVVPAAIAKVPTALRALSGGLPDWLPGGDDTAQGSGFLGILSGLGLTAALGRLALKPVQRAAPRLGGVLLGVLVLLFAGKVATDAAYREGLFALDGRGYAIAAAGFFLAYFVLNQASWSPHVLYLARLRSTFATREGRGPRSHAGVSPRSYDEEGTWDDYRRRNQLLPYPLPELLVCAAAQRDAADVTGVPAVSFVFSAHEVVMVDDTVDASDEGTTDPALHSNRYSVATTRYKHTTARRLVTPSGATAMSGAAFTSAMGRHSYGSSNALLAALNLRLGVWMPNPRYVVEDDQHFKRPRLSYLVKELFGRYDLSDPYVYVTDGGHWENLGLVELVRRRCKWITCIDASGDRGTFGTLSEAITLARVACHAHIEIDRGPLAVDPSTGLHRDCVSLGVIRYHCGPDHAPTRRCVAAECPTGVLLYLKSVVSPYAPLAVQAYALQDRRFPNYSTLDQFLTEAQFDRLVLLARSAAARAEKRRQELCDALRQPGGCRDPHVSHVAGRLRSAGFRP